MYKTLSEYIAALERAGELVRVNVPVDPVLEIAELTDREAKSPGGGRALLFENTGTPFPVLTNMMGSDRRIAMALGVESVDMLTGRIEELFAALTSPRPDLFDKLRMLPLLGRMSRWLPREVKGRGVCQQVVLQGDAARLDLLPVLKCWPQDGGCFVTLPLVHTLDPDTGVRNVGMYRMQLFSPQTTGMHWHLHKTGERHYRAYQRLGKRMPVTVCLGGDPAYTYAATAPMPDNMDEYLLAGFLRERPVELVKCVTNDLRVPADCDIVIEGYVDPSEEKVIEGPFGDHTGFYSLEDYYPLFHVTAITHRRGAVYPATIVGVPPQEDAYIAKATEKIFLAPIRAAMLPEVRDLWMPEAGVAHNIAVVDIRTDYAGQALKAASSLWGAGQMMFNKFMVVTASGRPVRDVAALADLLRRIRIPDDLMFSRGPLDVLDHAAPETGLGGKLMFDATGVDPAAPLETVQLPFPFELSDGIVRVDYALSESWRVLLLSAPRGVRPDVFAFLEKNRVEGIKYVILLDEEVDTSRPGDVLWIASSDCDPSRDVTIRDGVVLFDCRSKAGGVNGFLRRWPNVVASSPETIARVDGRWNEYGLGKFMLSPSLHYSRLQYGEGAAVPAGGPLPGKTTEDTHAESGGSCRNPKQNPSG
ncbi:menaquinone biosynthesis decarboxylase [Alistipes indistinctus]|uniref:menaquinone biosynthesis decarboxylase n=1 Tax=Alistipes indistinctus TaxID=626932 RepID=UPI00242AAA95|nr:menaquinone biosynthesis decarboxylase [Alistipes indistinctus]